LICGSAFGQQPPRRPGPGAGREEAWKVIDAYIVSNLQEGLGLSDDQFVKLLPLVKKLQKDRRELAQHRRQALQELRRTLEAGGTTEAKALDQLKVLKTLEVEEPAAIRKDIEAVDASITPIQQARFRVMEVEIEARIRQMLSRVRAERRLNRGPTQPGPTGDDEPPEQN
jgi:hypothetical protein